MDTLVIPVLNGMLPRPADGVLPGVFIDPFAISSLSAIGVGGEVLVCPLVPHSGEIYPVGVLARISELRPGEVMALTPPVRLAALFVRLTGRARARVQRVYPAGNYLAGRGLQSMDLLALRSAGYPTICGAGWSPRGGQTETRSAREIRVTVYGVDQASGDPVSIAADLGGVITPEQAHTIEHGIIRSLRGYGICTPKTLPEMVTQETAELKDSVELGIKLQMPEIFGITSSGVCGNPLTNLARFYLSRETLRQLKKGKDLPDSVDRARQQTLSRLTEELEISPRSGLRVLQGLKRGMQHDDSRLSEDRARQVLERFPPSPWL